MFFRQLLHEDQSCASYLVGCPTLGTCAVVDPQGDPRRYIEMATHQAMRITHVIDTHVHADHLSAAQTLAAATKANLYLGDNADVGFDFSPLDDGDVLEIGNRRIQIMSTPGHSPEHVCLLVDDWFVLTGDTLFVGDVGRIDLALTETDESVLQKKAKALYESLRKLIALRDDVEIYPGHYAGSTCGRGIDGKTISTIGHERRENQALSMGVEEFIEYQLSNFPAMPADFEMIKRANIHSEAPKLDQLL